MPVHCGPQSEQDLLSTQQGDGSPTPSVMDQIKFMHGNMSQLLQKLEAQVNSFQQENSMLETKVQSVVNTLYHREQNINNLLQDKEMLEHTINDRQQIIISLQQEKDTLVAKVQSMDAKVKDLEQTLYERQHNINSLQQEKGTLAAKVQSMDAKVKDLEHNITSLQQEKGSLDNMVQWLENTLHTRQQDLNRFVQQWGELDDKVKHLEQTLCNNQQSMNSLQQEKGTLEAKVQELEDMTLMHTQRIHGLMMFCQALHSTLYSSPYPIRNRAEPGKHGCALIINNTQFTTSVMSERTGAEGDTQKLEEAFKSLPVNTEVKTHQNLDLPNMLNVLRDEANRDHTDEDFFICCIMSHGTQGKVFATDGFSAELLEILSLFNGKRCPSLKGKPKLFFINACQGDKDQTSEREGAHSDASPSPILAYLSTEADFFLALATVPGYVSYRGEDGADFVNVLAKVLKEDGESQDLMSMMATVSRELNKKYKYSPFCCTTLRHKLFFKPNLFPQDLPSTSSLPPTIETPNDRYRTQLPKHVFHTLQQLGVRSDWQTLSMSVAAMHQALTPAEDCFSYGLIVVFWF